MLSCAKRFKALTIFYTKSFNSNRLLRSEW